MVEARNVTPDEMYQRACNAYGLDKPVDPQEWNLVLNYWAANIAGSLEIVKECLKVLARIYDCPLPENHILTIAKFQFEKRPPECGAVKAYVCKVVRRKLMSPLAAVTECDCSEGYCKHERSPV